MGHETLKVLGINVSHSLAAKKAHKVIRLSSATDKLSINYLAPVTTCRPPSADGTTRTRNFSQLGTKAHKVIRL
jgi:hypothetical protein